MDHDVRIEIAKRLTNTSRRPKRVQRDISMAGAGVVERRQEGTVRANSPRRARVGDRVLVFAEPAHQVDEHRFGAAVSE
jgi:hypothetical protein